jgi:cyclic pyranopterin monophosphate synthase
MPSPRMTPEMARLSHVDRRGAAQMVDISDKPETVREAIASGIVRMQAETLRAISEGTLPKGDTLTVARVAGIMAAKRASELIPLCHPLPLSLVEVHCIPDAALPGIRIESRVRCTARTGAEMEALTAVAVTALTIYDMAKSADRWMTIEGIALQRKRGGKSGDLARPSGNPSVPTASARGSRRGTHRATAGTP